MDNSAKLKIMIVAALALLLFGNFAQAQNAMPQRCEPSTDCVIGEFVYGDDGHTPVTTDNYCQITITNPADSVIANGVNMSDKNDGWHYYTANIASPNGLYRASMCCDTDAARQCIDKSFVLGTTLDTVATKTDIAGIAASVWSYGTRALNSFDTLVSGIWTASTRRLTDKTLTDGGSLATESYLDTDKTELLAAINNNATLIGNLNDIAAADVWNYSTRGVNLAVDVSASSTMAVWEVAKTQLTSAGSIGKQVADNLDAAISSRSILSAGDVWSNAARTLTDNSADATALAVWNSAQRTLTNYGNNITAADVWNVLSSSLVTVGSIGSQLSANIDTAVSSRASQNSIDIASASRQKEWTVYLSDASDIAKGETYRAKLFALNYESTPADLFALPTVTIYDPVRNTVVENVAMAKLATGIYEYTYNVASSAVQGMWETEVSASVENGRVVKTNDYWDVAGSPAQVIINSISDNTVPGIAANITITNEGTAGYEYRYEWCVVNSQDNACGGNDDIFYSSAAKYILSGQDWVTDLAATVPNAGNYYFKIMVYFGTDRSGASQSFAAINGGGGGGGSGGSFTGQAILKNIENGLSAVGQAICNQNTFPCNIILKILARLDKDEKNTAALQASVASLSASVNKLLNAAPRQVIVKSPPTIKYVAPKVTAPAPAPTAPKHKANIKLET